MRFRKSSLEYAEDGMHKDVLEWLNDTKKIDHDDDLTEVDYLPNSSFIHYILNADNYHYDLSAMLFYSIERNYPLFVIKYLVSLGASDEFIFYRGPPFEISQSSMDKAIEMKRTDIINYLKKIGFEKYEYSDSNEYMNNDSIVNNDFNEHINNDSNTVKEQKTSVPKKFTKLWREEKFKGMGENVINDIYTSDAYKIRFMIDNFNFCKLRFDCFDKNYVENKKMMFDEQENIDFNKKHGIMNKEGFDPYDYDFLGLNQSISFEEAWIYCEQAYDLYQKGKKSEDDSLCTLARNHIIDKMNGRMIDHNNYGKEVWQYFLDLMK